MSEHEYPLCSIHFQQLNSTPLKAIFHLPENQLFDFISTCTDLNYGFWKFLKIFENFLLKEKKVFVMKKVKESQETEPNQSSGICVTIFYFRLHIEA